MIAKSDHDGGEPRPELPYTPLTAAKKAGVHRKTIYEGISKDQFPHFRIGRKVLIPRRPFDRLVEEGKVA